MIEENTRILCQFAGYLKVKDITTEEFPVWTGNSIAVASKSLTEEQETLKVKLISGVELHCSPDQLFKSSTKYRKESLIVPAKDLVYGQLVYLNDNTYEFDYLDLSCYKYLSRLTSQQLGILVGLMYALGSDGRILDLPKVRKESYQAIELLLNRAKVPFVKQSYYKRTDRNKYTVEDEEFLSEISDFIVRDKVPEIFWTSKLLWAGFLKSAFTFCTIGTEMMTIRSSKDSTVLKEIQQALLLFGINSSWSKGLKLSQLLVFKNNCYRLCYNIGLFNAEKVFGGLDFRRFLKYKDRTMFDMRHTKVLNVEKAGIQTVTSFGNTPIMANGVILENYE